MLKFIHRLLAEPLTKNKDIDDPETTIIRKQIIQKKKYLNKIYYEWYNTLIANIPNNSRYLEIGSGAGFIKKIKPDIITSEFFQIEGVDKVIDAQNISFEDQELDGILMIDVFHHISNVEKFFEEARRCVKPGGQILMIEPWNTRWSKFVFTKLHHENFDPDSNWQLKGHGPLSSANGALPWIVFERDYEIFKKKYPNWKLDIVKLFMPFSYLLSGGVSIKTLTPGWSYSGIRYLEELLNQKKWAMFAFIKIQL